VSDHGFWAVQSLVTGPGPAAAAIDRLPPGLGTLRAASFDALGVPTLTGQPSPSLADLRAAYRRPEFVVPDTVTSYSPARTDVPAVIDVSAVARAAS